MLCILLLDLVIITATALINPYVIRGEIMRGLKDSKTDAILELETMEIAIVSNLTLFTDELYKMQQAALDYGDYMISFNSEQVDILEQWYSDYLQQIIEKAKMEGKDLKNCTDDILEQIHQVHDIVSEYINETCPPHIQWILDYTQDTSYSLNSSAFAEVNKFQDQFNQCSNNSCFDDFCSEVVNSTDNFISFIGDQTRDACLNLAFSEGNFGDCPGTPRTQYESEIDQLVTRAESCIYSEGGISCKNDKASGMWRNLVDDLFTF